MAKFNKLDVPHQWKDEFTKYPHGYTIFEALCKWVKQVDNMVDNINNWNDYLDNFVENFEFELQEEVQSTIERWQNEGLLDGIIESALNTELDNVKKRLAQTPKQTSVTDIKGLWKSKKQTPSTDTLPNDNSTHPDDFYSLYDELSSKVKDGYMVKHNMGKDSSGLYDFNYYVLEPDSPEKTVVLGSALHGDEKMGAVLLYRFIKILIEDYGDNPALVYLRNRVRFVVIPIQNPYGFRNNHRTNVTPVDLNRNFPPYWSGWSDGQPKGSEPLSELETNYINTLMTMYPDTVSCIDIHNTGIGLEGFYCAIPRFGETERNAINKVALALDPTMPLKLTRDIGPTLANQATITHKINGLTVEWQPGQKGHVPYSAEDTQFGLDFIGNIIIQMCAINKPNVEKINEPMVIRITTEHLSTQSTLINEWEEISELNYTFAPQVDGVVEVIASITSQNSAEEAITFFSTAIIQDRHEIHGVTSIATQQTLTEVFSAFGGRAGNLSLNNAVRVYASRDTEQDHFGPVEIKFYFKTNVGSISLRRNRILIRFTPTDGSNQFLRIIEASDGSLLQTYPPIN